MCFMCAIAHWAIKIINIEFNCRLSILQFIGFLVQTVKSQVNRFFYGILKSNFIRMNEWIVYVCCYNNVDL